MADGGMPERAEVGSTILRIAEARLTAIAARLTNTAAGHGNNRLAEPVPAINWAAPDRVVVRAHPWALLRELGQAAARALEMSAAVTGLVAAPAVAIWEAAIDRAEVQVQ